MSGEYKWFYQRAGLMVLAAVLIVLLLWTENRQFPVKVHSWMDVTTANRPIGN